VDFDFDAAGRWARSATDKVFRRRSDEDLPFLGESPGAGPELLLDACVYIDGLQGRVPDVVVDLLDIRLANHSTVAIQELMHAIGVLDPAHPGTKTAAGRIADTIRAMNRRRIFAPDADILGRAALVSGILSRRQAFKNDARFRAMQDCALFLQAQRLGFSVLTANIGDFDYLLQLFPTGRVLFYRPVRVSQLPVTPDTARR
jgi:hypothetical protein